MKRGKSAVIEPKAGSEGVTATTRGQYRPTDQRGGSVFGVTTLTGTEAIALMVTVS